MNLEQQIANFDVNGVGLPDTLFGLPFTLETARMIILPMPWEATVSYETGTAKAPEAVLKASRQIDFYVREIPDAWKMGIAMGPIPTNIKAESDRVRKLVDYYHATGEEATESAGLLLNKVNEALENLNVYVKQVTQQYMHEGKIVGLLGGDHSTPLGFIRALCEKHDKFGVLQIDAHADLRKSYEGFVHSHGSIMYNILKYPSINRLVQVGIRDYCEEEVQTMKRGAGRVITFFDQDIHHQLENGKTWDTLCQEFIEPLPNKVYISFDIDGLNPSLCPHTGTPVPGGLNFYQATTLLQAVVRSGRTIIGFDLCEIAPGSDTWDANVGSRILWHLCNWTGVSNRILTAQANR